MTFVASPAPLPAGRFMQKPSAVAVVPGTPGQHDVSRWRNQIASLLLGPAAPAWRLEIQTPNPDLTQVRGGTLAE